MRDDIAVGAYLDDNNGFASVSVRVFSGRFGNVLYTINGGAGDGFGASVSGIGDINNDGYDDMVIGAIYADPNGSNSGSAHVVVGNTGAMLYTLNGNAAGDRFGTSVSGAGDTNGDGVPDIIVGADATDPNASGSASLFSGTNGSLLFTFRDGRAEDKFGHSVSGGGDINGDGLGDVIIGVPRDDIMANNGGSVRIISLGTDWDNDGVNTLDDAEPLNPAVQ
ncbi:hypothetical protein AB835_09625 [Candidatus Endobugula sertula]|uniref:Uncharacterized protein n=1 Tax=Candidatus Endobugula sertula TaxID=62101 RepID=A0A1D2QNZ3_9GAMM|nr:hypothetical protein AB835_09625 [Candidatus Endobugula sertula]